MGSFDRGGRRGASAQAPLDVVLRCFAAAVSAESAALICHDGAGRPELVATWGRAARISGARWIPDRFLERVIWGNEPAVELADNANGDRLRPAVTAIAAPIIGPIGTIGAVYADLAGPSDLPPAHLRGLAASHAALAGLCMQEGAHIAASLRSSFVDDLTGCLTYGRTLETLSAEIERSTRRGHALSCGFLDLDGFKDINEALGHMGGNRVLAATGGALRDCARTYDSVGRFGGDEFLIVLPETDARVACRAVERVRGDVSVAVREATGTAIELSAGVSAWYPGHSAHDVLEASDRALRAARAAGGARVAVEAPERQPH
jgi:diguanylate cyclase (GGDEF)-like protein